MVGVPQSDVQARNKRQDESFSVSESESVCESVCESESEIESASATVRVRVTVTTSTTVTRIESESEDQAFDRAVAESASEALERQGQLGREGSGEVQLV